MCVRGVCSPYGSLPRGRARSVCVRGRHDGVCLVCASEDAFPKRLRQHETTVQSESFGTTPPRCPPPYPPHVFSAPVFLVVLPVALVATHTTFLLFLYDACACLSRASSAELEAIACASSLPALRCPRAWEGPGRSSMRRTSGRAPYRVCPVPLCRDWEAPTLLRRLWLPACRPLVPCGHRCSPRTTLPPPVRSPKPRRSLRPPSLSRC